MSERSVISTFGEARSEEMTAEEKNERIHEIERLSESLERWLKTPMLESVKEIGAEAIKSRMSELARPLKEEE